MNGPMPGVEGARVQEVSRLPALLPGAVRVAPYSVARPGAVLRCVPGLARFLARDGTLVEVACEPKADRREVESLLAGPLAAALIHQRGELPLHGAALVAPTSGNAVVIVGRQGSGKSTLAYELVQIGWSLLSDDLVRLTSDAGVVLAWPGRIGVKLCRDACERVSLPLDALKRVSGEREKYLVPITPQRDPVPVRLIVALDRNAAAACTEIKGAAALALLTEHTHRLAYVSALGQTRSHLRMVATTLVFARVVRLSGAATPHEHARAIYALIVDRCTD